MFINASTLPVLCKTCGRDLKKKEKRIKSTVKKEEEEVIIIKSVHVT